MTDEVIVKDFSRQRKRIVIRLDGQEYDARPAIGLPTLQRVQAIQRKYQDPALNKIDMFAEMFEVLLRTEDAPRFLAALNDEDNPIDAEQLNEMITFVMERNGGRPTGESSASVDGSSSAASGTTSTDGVSPMG